jgi:hypothetical protein
MGQSTPPDPPTTNGLRRLVLIWAVLFGSLMVFAAAKSEPTDGPVAPRFGEFLVDLDRGRIEHVDLRTRDNSARVEARGDRRELQPADAETEVIHLNASKRLPACARRVAR